tara:strand:+ start:732 stop:1028 length:297 start_codon:yes stop_codon:yes gene_type:complete
MNNNLDPDKIKPYGELVSIRKEWGKEKTTEEGIIYTEKGQGGLHKAYIVRVGEKVTRDVKPGDVIMVEPQGNMRGQIKDVYFMHEDGIVMIVDEEDAV